MSYTPTAGIITAIEYQGDGAFGGSDCTLLLTVQSEDQGLVHILLPPGSLCAESASVPGGGPGHVLLFPGSPHAACVSAQIQGGGSCLYSPGSDGGPGRF